MLRRIIIKFNHDQWNYIFRQIQRILENNMFGRLLGFGRMTRDLSCFARAWDLAADMEKHFLHKTKGWKTVFMLSSLVYIGWTDEIASPFL